MFTPPNPQDAIHKVKMCQLLTAIADNPYLASVLYFKGGTCAAMLDWLDRFSIDLDFDYAGTVNDVTKTRKALENIADDLEFSIKDFSKRGIQYFFGYENTGRTTLKLDTAFPLLSSSNYSPQRLTEIDRILTCQTRDTMFAHKLIALPGRFKTNKQIAGRDVYDIHYFFMHAYNYNVEVIRERHGDDVHAFFSDLHTFIENHVTDKLLQEDLSSLIPPNRLWLMRKHLKQETLMLIRDEIARLSKQ